MTGTLFIDVEVAGRRVDVRYSGGIVTEIGPQLARRDDDLVDGSGGALLPGLHDHHLHLLSLAAVRYSIDCSDGLAALVDAPGTGWLRGVRASVSVDRHVLDRLVPSRPVRVQHQTGGLWMLNSLALSAVAPLMDAASGVERDLRGEPTGRLWRLDQRLGDVLGHADAASQLLDVAAELRSLGITSVTDATPDLTRTSEELLRDFPLEVTALGGFQADAPMKVLIHDHELPSFQQLKSRVLRARDDGRAVAVHAVTRESLLLTLAVLDDVGRVRGDRIEHGSVIVDPGQVADLQVVTQPGFISDRGDRYLAEVDVRDHSLLYRYQSLLDHGVQVLPSSDAPFGPLDPWGVMRAAVERRTRSGKVLNASERVAPATVLDGYIRDARGVRRTVSVGSRTPLLLLDVPLDRGLTELECAHVRGTWTLEQAPSLR